MGPQSTPSPVSLTHPKHRKIEILPPCLLQNMRGVWVKAAAFWRAVSIPTQSVIKSWDLIPGEKFQVIAPVDLRAGWSGSFQMTEELYLEKKLCRALEDGQRTKGQT